MKEERSKQGETNKVKQTKQSNTAHPRQQSLFQREMSCLANGVMRS